MKPVVLIHGAWHGAWCFEPIVQRLEFQNIPVHAIDLPLEGSDGDVAVTRELLKDVPGCIVLGHSYGGYIISKAARDLDVEHLVYLAAIMPAVGEDLGELMQKFPTSGFANALVSGEDSRVTIDKDKGIEVFYHLCSPEDAVDATSKLRPHKMGDTIPLDQAPAWKSIPSTYVVCELDRALSPELQEHFAKRATNIERLRTDHSPFFSQPDNVAKLLARLAT